MRYELTEEEWKLIVEHRKKGISSDLGCRIYCKHDWFMFYNDFTPSPTRIMRRCALCNITEPIPTAGFYG